MSGGPAVLHVVASARRRGAETFATDLIRAIDRNGCRQSVAILTGDPQEVEFGVSSRALAGGVGSHALRPTAAVLLRSMIRGSRSDVVQVHGGEALKYASLAAPAASVVYRRIGGSPTALTSRSRRRLYATLMGRAARVVAVGERLRCETIHEFRLDPERVVTIPNGVDRDRIAPRRSRDETRASLGIERDATVVLSVGALSWEKDPRVHVDVAHRLAADRPGLVHLMAGDGPMREEMAASADGVTRVLGSRADVGDLMVASDVLLFASRPDGMEGMPAVAIEAAMLGLPLAGYDVASVGEVVGPCASGTLVLPGDVDGLTEAAARLLDDYDLAARIKTEAPTRATAFDIATIAERYLALYEEVATGG